MTTFTVNYVKLSHRSDYNLTECKTLDAVAAALMPDKTISIRTQYGPLEAALPAWKHMAGKAKSFLVFIGKPDAGYYAICAEVWFTHGEKATLLEAFNREGAPAQTPPASIAIPRDSTQVTLKSTRDMPRSERIAAAKHYLLCRQKLTDYIADSIGMVQSAAQQTAFPREETRRMARKRVQYHREMIACGYPAVVDCVRLERLLTRHDRIEAGRDVLAARFPSTDALLEVRGLLITRKRNRTKWDHRDA